MNKIDFVSSVRAALLVFLLSLSFHAFAALEINRSDRGIVGNLGLTTNSSGQILVSWAEYTDSLSATSMTEDASVFAQFINVDGELTGTATQLNTTQSAYNPQVILNDDGSFWAAWQSAPAGSDSQIYLRYFDTQGTPTGTEYFIDADDGSEFLHRLAVLSNGDIFIYWSESGNADGPLFRRQFKSDGSPVTAREKIVPTAVFTMSDFGQYTDTGYYAIAMEAFDSVSLFSTVPNTVADLMPFSLTNSVPGGAIGDLSLAVNNQNRLVSSWRELSGNESELYFTITLDDNLIANRVLAVDGYLDHASVDISNQGKFLISRAGIHPDTTDGEVNNAVIATLWTRDGVAEKSDFLLDNNPISAVGATRTSVDNSGNFIVAWNGAKNTSNGVKGVIRLQKIDQSGATLWNQNNDDDGDSSSSSGGSGGAVSPPLLALLLSIMVSKLFRRDRRHYN